MSTSFEIVERIRQKLQDPESIAAALADLAALPKVIDEELWSAYDNGIKDQRDQQAHDLGSRRGEIETEGSHRV